MPETELLKKGITRRSFLKTTAAAGGVAALSGWTVSALSGCNAIATVPVDVSAEEETKFVVCMANCAIQHCGQVAHVRDKKLVRTTEYKDATTPYFDRRPCLRGRDHVEYVYSDQRIKYPLKRTGDRGEGQWERITWEQAIEEIGAGFLSLQEQYGKQAIAVAPLTGSYGLIHGVTGAIPRFAGAIGGTSMNLSMDSAMPCGFARPFFSTAQGGSFGSHPWMMKDAKVIWAWGANTTESFIQSWKYLADAKQAGAKLIVVDPRYSVLAQKADLWVPLKPDTDAALILSMLFVILSEELDNKDFILKHTVGPYLVNASTGQFSRLTDMEGAPPVVTYDDVRFRKTWDKTIPYLVWDASVGKAVSLDEAIEPALGGSYKIAGTTVTPAYQLLKDHVSQYQPKQAEEITGVPAETIVELAHIFAKSVPNFVHTRLGLDRYYDADMITFALATLSSVVGNVGIPGSSVGGTSGGTTSQNPLWLTNDGKPAASLPFILLADVVKSETFNNKPWPIKALFVVDGNPLSAVCNGQEFINEVLPRLDLLVTSEIRMTETARYSDYILPAAHWFETEEVAGPFGTHLWEYSEKAIEPAFEAKSNLDMLRLLAERMGAGEAFQKTEREIIEYVLDSPALAEEGITAERLLKEKVLLGVKAKELETCFGDYVFATDTGKIEFYKPNPLPRADYGQDLDVEAYRLPDYISGIEARSTSDELADFPLLLIQEHGRWHVHTSFGAECPTIRELDPYPTVKVARTDAAERGIVTGDVVELFNERGLVQLVAEVTDELPQGLLSHQRGWQRGEYLAGSCQDLTKRFINPMTVNLCFNEVRVDLRKIERGEK
jgi:molybdopterin-containing oxidoreductase family molybdopterin binding subunit